VVISADDLLLLFSYLLVHSRGSVSNLTAELAFMSDFIPDHQRCTMQGYYLTTQVCCAELLLRGDLLRDAPPAENESDRTTDETPPAADALSAPAAAAADTPAIEAQSSA